LIAHHLQHILEKAGYIVIGMATNKADAITLVEKEVPDMILMDIMLSGDDDGIDTITQIQKDYEIPVIYLTALTDRGTVERAKTTRPYGYIMKPFQEEQVITLMEMALHKYTAENKLKESEKKFKAAVSAFGDAFIFLNEDFKIAYMNRSAEVLTGCLLEECQDQNFYQLIKLKDFYTGEDVVNLWKGSDKEQNLPIDEMYLIKKSGKKIPIGDGTISKVYDHKNKLKGVVFTFRDITEKITKINLEKEIAKQRLSAMIDGQEQERSRIARELHDGLGQMLNAVKLQITELSKKNDTEKKAMTTLSEMVNDAILETSRISENLISSKLKDFDLATCLLSLSNHEYPDLNISFETTGVDNVKLTMSKKINLYRITQELISNCLKHAEASQLSIQLRGKSNGIVLTVEDDGKGFDLTEQKKKVLNGHNGLQNVKDRVSIMNGKIDVDSKKDLGSLIIIDVPYK